MNNERFTGSAAAWVIVIAIFVGALFCFLLALFTMGKGTAFSLIGWILLVTAWIFVFLIWARKRS
jgi:hypothetical protein